MREELDTDVDVGELVFEIEHAYPERTVALYFYRCRLRGTPRPLLGQEMRWVPRSGLATLGFPPADEELIRLLTSPSTGRAAGQGGSAQTRRRPAAQRPAVTVADRASTAAAVPAATKSRCRYRARSGRAPATTAALVIDAHLAIAGEHLRVAGGGALEPQANQLARHAAAAAMEHADDDFLADVAALGEARSRDPRCRPRAEWCRRSCRRRTPDSPPRCAPPRSPRGSRRLRRQPRRARSSCASPRGSTNSQ